MRSFIIPPLTQQLFLINTFVLLQHPLTFLPKPSLLGWGAALGDRPALGWGRGSFSGWKGSECRPLCLAARSSPGRLVTKLVKPWLFPEAAAEPPCPWDTVMRDDGSPTRPGSEEHIMPKEPLFVLWMFQEKPFLVSPTLVEAVSGVPNAGGSHSWCP